MARHRFYTTSRQSALNDFIDAWREVMEKPYTLDNFCFMPPECDFKVDDGETKDCLDKQKKCKYSTEGWVSRMGEDGIKRVSIPIPGIDPSTVKANLDGVNKIHLSYGEGDYAEKKVITFPYIVHPEGIKITVKWGVLTIAAEPWKDDQEANIQISIE